jgi:phosphate starvation-inducible protein PhoH and related proteins
MGADCAGGLTCFAPWLAGLRGLLRRQFTPLLLCWTPAVIVRHVFSPLNNQRMAHLCGGMDAHLRAVEEGLLVRIQRRNEAFRIEGDKDAAERATWLLQSLYEKADEPIAPETLQLALVQARALSADRPLPSVVGAGTAAATPTKPVLAMVHPQDLMTAGVADQPQLHTRRSDLVGRTPNQQLYLRNILSHDITFGIGPAGTGKTYLAVACAVDALERSSVQRIILTRPAVEAGERLGFLPGDLAQKVDPYLRPLYDALYDLMGLDKVTRAFEKGLIEVAPLAFMRGRTLNHAFVILDEAQNTTTAQMKMFLTRIGFGSKCVVTGDVSQIDLPRGTESGLIDAERVLRRVKGMATTRFASVDVVRHPLVARIVEAYDAARGSDHS